MSNYASSPKSARCGCAPGQAARSRPTPRALSGGDCLIFSARDEVGGWLMIGPRQPNRNYADFEYGWVAANFLDNPDQILVPVATPIPTPMRAPLPTFTPTFTASPTFTPTPTDTRIPTATDVPVTP